MTAILALCVGALVGSGVYLLLCRSLLRALFGVVLLSHGANLLVFTLGGGARGEAPLVPPGETVPAASHADPVSQALVLTAIVIGFAVVAFLAVLVERAYRATRSLSLDDDAFPEESP
jgi:multicomponent Na+:H+ antiporter subunit C